MRRLIGVALLTALTGCVYLIPDYRSHSSGKIHTVPNVYLHLGSAPDVCANRDGFAEIVVFVNLYGFPPQDVEFLLNDTKAVLMHGKNLTLTLRKVGLGSHSVEVKTAGYHPVRLSFIVWDCLR